MSRTGCDDASQKKKKKKRRLSNEKKERKEHKKQKLNEAVMREVREARADVTHPMRHCLVLAAGEAYDQYVAAETCPLLQIHEKLRRLESDQMREAFITLVLRASTPEHGLVFALHTYMQALDALVTEALIVIATRFGNGRVFDRQKKKRLPRLTLRCEEVSLEKLLTQRPMLQTLLHDACELNDETRLYDDRDLLALHNDRALCHLKTYEAVNASRVTLFVLWLNETQLVTSMIVPQTALHFKLTEPSHANRNSYVRNYGELLEKMHALTSSQ